MINEIYKPLARLVKKTSKKTQSPILGIKGNIPINPIDIGKIL